MKEDVYLYVPGLINFQYLMKVALLECMNRVCKYQLNAFKKFKCLTAGSFLTNK